jgi:hypothetical protein
VKPRGRDNDFRARPFDSREMPCVGDDALDVHHVVRGIVRGHMLANEPGTACFEIRQGQSHEKRIPSAGPSLWL